VKDKFSRGMGYVISELDKMPPEPKPPLFKPVENQTWYRFCIFGADSEGLIAPKPIDWVDIHKASKSVVSKIYGALDRDPEKREMALDWMQKLKREPMARAVADRSMLN
jgi:hypothetical protein